MGSHSHHHSSQRHKDHAAEQDPVAIALLTVSDSRTAATDKNYQYLRDKIEQSRHTLADYTIVKDDIQEIERVLEHYATQAVQVVIINGGTGISQRDTTYDVVFSRLEKELQGFGEIFRMLSFEQVGSAAMLSRACAGTYCGKIIFSLPGSPKAVQLAWEKLIEPEIDHLVWELGR